MNEAAPKESMIELQRDPGKQTPEMISRARIAKAVGDIDRLCAISKLTVDEALTAFAVITAIKLSEMQRVAQLKWQKFFDREVKYQRKLKMQLDAQPKSEATLVSIDEAVSIPQEAIDALADHKTPDGVDMVVTEGNSGVLNEDYNDGSI